MTDEEFQQLIEIGHEVRGVEYKSPGRRDDGGFLVEVARAAIGMANRRDGGVVVIGITEKDKVPILVGVSTEVEATWNYDDTSAALGQYAEPSLSFDLEVRQLEGKRFVVLTIQEFETIPILCKKDGFVRREGRDQQMLKRAAIYVRPRRKPETSEVATLEDMQDLLNLAIDKGVKAFEDRAAAAGFVRRVKRSRKKSDSKAYEDELKGRI